MRSSIVAGLLASGVAAFSDSSPFLLYSTSKLSSPSPQNAAQVQPAAAVLATAQSLLSTCPTSLYLLHAHPNAHATDLRDPYTGACLAPTLCARPVADPAVQTTYGVAEVVADEGQLLSAAALREHIEAACEAAGKLRPVVVVTQLDALPGGGGSGARAAAMAAADAEMGRVLNATVSAAAAEENDYTVLYFASPHEAPRSYESEFVEDPVAPMELKRRTEGVLERAAGGLNSSAPLFEKYQFFTPGLFSAFLGAIILFSMLYVGLSAVASLQVSYGAFDKDMGPAAQKKN